MWYEPLVCYRIPKPFNLRMDPYERADVVSNQYDQWRIENAYLMGWVTFHAAALTRSSSIRQARNTCRRRLPRPAGAYVSVQNVAVGT